MTSLWMANGQRFPHPSASPEREPDRFNDCLPKLRRGILDSVRKTNQRLPLSLATDLQMSESRAPSSQRNTSKPDGGHVLRGEDWSWDQIAIPIELKKRATEADVNDVCRLLQYPHSVWRRRSFRTSSKPYCQCIIS